MISCYVRNPRCDFSLQIKDKFTVISGDSGTGKSILFNIILAKNKSVPLTDVQCDMNCIYLTDSFWHNEILLYNNSIVFVEEERMWVTSKKFYELAAETYNYYVIFSRDLLPYIPDGDIGFYEFKIDRTHHYMVPYTDYTVQFRKNLKFI